MVDKAANEAPLTVGFNIGSKASCSLPAVRKADQLTAIERQGVLRLMWRHTLKEDRCRILGEEWCAKAKGKNGRSPAPLVSETGRATSLVQLGQMKMPRLASKLAAGYIESGRGQIGRAHV